MKRVIELIYSKLANAANILNKKNEETPKVINFLFYGTNYWRLVFYSTLIGLTVTLTIIWAGVRKNGFPFSGVIGKAILYGLGGLLITFFAFSFGKIIASTKKLDFEKKKLIAVLTWIAIILVFLLPFIMVYIFGFD
tara:strand:- start:3531 stop:3941 length:411 start_codon:yes stop_codon:yes gene_type:complete